MLCCTLFLAGCGAPVDGGVVHDRAVGEYPLYDVMEGRGEALSVVDDAYRLGAEDRLRIHVFGEDDLSNSYQVGSDGSIAFPLIGQVVVRGKTVREVQDVLAVRLSDGYLIDPSISVEIDRYRSFYILGEVAAPGSYDYEAGMRVLKAVALAGGFTYRANRDEVRMLRHDGGEDDYIDVPVNAAFEAGDIIVVKERFF
ncbi:MAG: polysaccharide biosynthesis/export family protein [Alphaproteobacteria bacterium]